MTRWRTDDPEMQRTGTDDLGPLFDKALPYAKHSDTSRDAAEAFHSEAARLRRRVLGAYRMAGDFGMTPDQTAKLLGITVLACRPRCTELLQAGLLVRTGERRKNASGMSAAVLRIR